MASQSASPAELENLGVLFMGFIFATFMYGFTFFQLYIYTFRYPNDKKSTRVLVWLLATLDSASTALVTHESYYYLVEQFSENLEVLYAIPTSCAQDLLSSVITLLTQFFFASRLYTVCGGPTSIISRVVVLVVCLLAVVSFVFGSISVAQIIRQPELSAMASPSMAIIAGISQGSAAVAYIIIFIALCWALRPARYPDMIMPASVTDKVVAVLVERGLALIVFQLAYLVAFIVLPTKPYWMAFQMVTCRVCVNTVLGLFNSREIRRGVGVNVEESVSDTNDSQGGLPSLHFRWPTNPKATQQRTLNFSTQMTDSAHSDVEQVSKAFEDDEHLSSVRSRCTEQPEGKTRFSSELDV